MSKLRIVGWTSFDSAYPTRMITNEELLEQLSLIKEEIAKNGYRFSGEEHQNSLTGVPVFSDGTCFRASMRSWGMIMASLNEGTSYMDFYMTLESGSKLPEFSNIDVKPCKVKEESSGIIVQQDRDIIEQSLSMNMMFMTTDKVLNNLYNKLKK